MDLSGYADGTAAAGGCHATLHVCIDSDGFRLPHNDNGRFRVRLSVADAAARSRSPAAPPAGRASRSSSARG